MTISCFVIFCCVTGLVPMRAFELASDPWRCPEMALFLWGGGVDKSMRFLKRVKYIMGEGGADVIDGIF